MNTVGKCIVLLAPLLFVTGFDVTMLFTLGYDYTITGVVRAWAEKSAWPEAVYLLGAVVLYGHLFRGWF